MGPNMVAKFLRTRLVGDGIWNSDSKIRIYFAQNVFICVSLLFVIVTLIFSKMATHYVLHVFPMETTFTLCFHTKILVFHNFIFYITFLALHAREPLSNTIRAHLGTPI